MSPSSGKFKCWNQDAKLGRLESRAPTLITVLPPVQCPGCHQLQGVLQTSCWLLLQALVLPVSCGSMLSPLLSFPLISSSRIDPIHSHDGPSHQPPTWRPVSPPRSFSCTPSLEIPLSAPSTSVGGVPWAPCCKADLLELSSVSTFHSKPAPLPTWHWPHHPPRPISWAPPPYSSFPSSSAHSHHLSQTPPPALSKLSSSICLYQQWSPVILNWGQFCLSGDICLRVVTTGGRGYYWHPAGRGQRDY